MLLPVIGLIQVGVQSMADRYMYLPFIGLAIVVVWFTAEQLKREGSNRCCDPCCVDFALLTWNQANYWRSNVALFTHAIDVIGESATCEATSRSLCGRTAGRQRRSRSESAWCSSRCSAPKHIANSGWIISPWVVVKRRDQLERAMSLDPHNSFTYLNLAQYFESAGNIPNAIATLREGMRRVPQSQDLQAVLDRLTAGKNLALSAEACWCGPVPQTGGCASRIRGSLVKVIGTPKSGQSTGLTNSSA